MIHYVRNFLSFSIEGKLPVSLLLNATKYWRLERLLNSVGIVPDKLLFDAYKTARFSRLPMEEGISPPILGLLLTLSSCNEIILPILAGIVPLKSFP